MYCRGTKRRQEIVKEYQLECTAHIRLLNGRVIRSDAERDITRTYYIFVCTNRNNPADIQQICCGEGAAAELIKLANITAPPIFNMLHEEQAPGPGGGGHPALTWDPAAKQLYNAIMILITAWDLQPGPIFTQLKYARKYYYCKPYVDRVRKINDILCRHKTSMRDIINKIAQNNQIKEYKFNLLEEILHSENIVSYFEDSKGS